MTCTRGARVEPSDVVHLELHTASSDAALDFLSRLLEWRSEPVARAGQTYLAMDMGEWIGGGVVECGTRDAQWLPYVRVNDVDETTHRARRLGGCVLLDPRQGPAGRRSIVTTPATGAIALWQPTSGRMR